MKLLFLSGERQGQMHDLAPQGTHLGREEDNDVILADGQASRYHAKIERAEGIWRLEDLNSRNGVYMNGEKVNGTANLNVGDLIRIGTIELRVTDDEGNAPIPGGDSGTDQAGAGEAPKQGLPPKARLAVLAGGLFLAMIVLGLLLFGGGSGNGGNGQPVNGGNGTTPHGSGALTPREDLPPSALRVYLERMRYGADGIHRYEIEIHEGRLSLVLDDVKNGVRARPEPAELSENQLDELCRALLTTEFLTLQSPPPGERRNEQEQLTLMVAQGPYGNVFRLDNGPALSVYEVADDNVDRLVMLAQEEFEIMIDVGDSAATAEREYELGKDRVAKREIRPENWSEGIRNLATAIKLVTYMDPKPEWYEDAVTTLREQRAIFDAYIKKLLDDAQFARAAGDCQTALVKYREVTALLKDQRDDPRYDEARKGILICNEQR